LNGFSTRKEGRQNAGEKIEKRGGVAHRKTGKAISFQRSSAGVIKGGIPGRVAKKKVDHFRYSAQRCTGSVRGGERSKGRINKFAFQKTGRKKKKKEVHQISARENKGKGWKDNMGLQEEWPF